MTTFTVKLINLLCFFYTLYKYLIPHVHNSILIVYMFVIELIVKLIVDEFL